MAVASVRVQAVNATNIKSMYEWGTWHIGKFRYAGVDIQQHPSKSIIIDQDGKLKLTKFKNEKLDNLRSHKIEAINNTQFPPELFESEHIRKSFKQEIWSLGIILFQMCTLKLPFQGSSPLKTI